MSKSSNLVSVNVGEGRKLLDQNTNERFIFRVEDIRNIRYKLGKRCPAIEGEQFALTPTGEKIRERSP